MTSGPIDEVSQGQRPPDESSRVASDTVEGMPPTRKVRRIEIRVIVPLLILAVIATAIVAYFIGGWAAVALGGVLICTYYLVGWSPAIGAALLRNKSRKN